LIMDTLITSQGESILSGSYIDETFGEVKAKGYLNFALPLPNNFPQDSAVIDSMAFRLRVNYYYGNQFTTEKRFAIHQLTESLSGREINNNESVGYAESPLAEGAFTVAAGADTTLFFKTENEVLSELFTQVITRSSVTQTQAAFDDYFKGIAIVADEANDAIMGFRTNETNSGLTYYYRYPSDTVSRTFNFSISLVQNGSQLISERSGTPLEPLVNPLENLDLDGDYVYFQAGIGIIPKIDLRTFKEFSDSISSLILLKAELAFEGIEVDNSQFKFPPSAIVHYLTDERNTLIIAGSTPRGINEPGTDAVTGNRPLFTPYSTIRKGYFTDATLFFQAYYDGRILNEDLLIFAERMNVRVNQMKIRKENIKLRLYYLSN
jgi:hypothetical protein